MILQGKPMQDPFGEQRGTFKFGSLLTRLRALKEKLESKDQAKAEEVEVVPKDTAMDVEHTNVAAPTNTEVEGQSNQLLSAMETELSGELDVQPYAASPMSPEENPGVGETQIDSFEGLKQQVQLGTTGQTQVRHEAHQDIYGSILG
jgi:hypothetical protein